MIRADVILLLMALFSPVRLHDAVSEPLGVDLLSEMWNLFNFSGFNQSTKNLIAPSMS